MVENSIFLLLFFDAAHFSNSIDGKVWAILAIILNLPLAIRQAFLNVVPILFWQGHVHENFNNIIKHHLKELLGIIETGISFQIGTIKVNFKVFIGGLIGDAPGEAKLANSIQFNGKFGCIRCLNSGKMIKRTRIYAYKKDVQLRSNALYSIQAQTAEHSKVSFEGIKGDNLLSQFCEFPNAVLIDSMHLFGIVKRFLFLWFDSKNSETSFYMGKIY